MKCDCGNKDIKIRKEINNGKVKECHYCKKCNKNIIFKSYLLSEENKK